MRTLLTVGIEAACIAGLIVAGKTAVERVDLVGIDGVSAQAEVTPPLCSYAAPIDVVDLACHARGLHAVNVLVVDGDNRNTCISPVCDLPFTPRIMLPFPVGSPCFKSETRNVCQGPAVCVMPSPEAPNAAGQVIQKVGVCK